MTTTSGTADFQLTRNELITTVLEVLHVLEPGQTAQAADITMLARVLNMLVKRLVMKGVNLWTFQRLILPLSAALTDYLLGPGGGTVVGATIDNGGSGYGAPPGVTFSAPGGGGVTATGTAVLTSGSVTSITITNAGSKYATRPTITFGSGTAAATARLNGIFCTRPLKVLNARSRNTTSGSEVEMNRLGRREYDGMSMKSTAGQVPVDFYYDPQLDNGVLSLFPTPSSNTAYDARLSVQRPLQDVNLSTENVDIPQEAFLMLQWLLANEVSLRYVCPMEVVKHIREQAMMYNDEFFDWDGGQDHTNIVFEIYPEGEGGNG